MAEQRLIDANAIIPKLKFIREGETQIYGINSFDFSGKCITAIEDAPTIEERKNGKWIYGENKYGHDGWQCDQCGHWILWDYHVSMEDAERDLSKYCPNCGADMRGTP